MKIHAGRIHSHFFILFKHLVHFTYSSVLVLGLLWPARAEDIVLKVAVQDHPHVRAILDGRVKAQGCEVHLSTASMDALNQDLNGAHAFDILEVDVVLFLKNRAAGGLADYELIPVFLSRGFQLRNTYIRTDRGIHGPADLRGKTVAVSDRSRTASVWVGGVLHSSWGVKPSEIILKELPDPLKALQEGQVDAAFSVKEPEHLGDKNAKVIRLFEDYYKAEYELFETTRVFPIRTALAVKKSIAEANPWLSESVFIAFVEAKKKAQADLTLPLPWTGPKLDETEKLMGANFWSYGIKNNPKTLDALFRYSAEQNHLEHPLKIEDVFDPSTLMLLDD